MITLLKQDLAKYTVLAGLLGLLLLGLYLFVRAHLGSKLTNELTSARVALPQADSEQLLINPRDHTITIKQAGKTRTVSLPDKQTTIDVLKDGQVVVTAPQYGLEFRPFVGLGYSDDARFALGVDGFYWKKLDLGGGLQMNFHLAQPRAFLSLSYTLIDNLRVSATIDHKKQPGIFVSLRF